MKKNGGRKPNQGQGTGKINKHRDKGGHPHLSRRGTIQISMIYIIQIPSTRDGMRKGGNEIIREMIPEENCNTLTHLKGDGRTKKRGNNHGSPRGLMGYGGGHKQISSSPKSQWL